LILLETVDFVQQNNCVDFVELLNFQCFNGCFEIALAFPALRLFVAFPAYRPSLFLTV
jgi:hypothetical protein